MPRVEVAFSFVAHEEFGQALSVILGHGGNLLVGEAPHFVSGERGRVPRVGNERVDEHLSQHEVVSVLLDIQLFLLCTATIRGTILILAPRGTWMPFDPFGLLADISSGEDHPVGLVRWMLSLPPLEKRARRRGGPRPP